MGDDKDLRAVAPAVMGMPVADRNIQMAVEAQDLQRMMPTFYNAEEAGVVEVLDPREPVPEDVTGVSFTLPEVVAVWFGSYTGAEQTIGFPDIVKGVGCAAYAVEMDQISKVQALVEELAKAVGEGSDPPSVDARFAAEVKECLDAIFANGEPVSYRSLLAFMIGAFWLLGFVRDPERRRGRLSPVDFVKGMVVHYAQLAYLPT